MPLADGQMFAGYTVGRILGAGGMGEVYLAQHPRLPRRDALKVLGVEVSHDEEYRQRFNQEAEMVATLRHPNIVTIYDRGDCDDYGDDNHDNYCADSDMLGCLLLYVPLRLDSCDSGSDLAGRGRCRHPDLHFHEHWIEWPR